MEQIPSHADIMERIEQHENKIERWFVKLISSFLAFVGLAFLWVWGTYTTQAAFNAEMNARTQGNMMSLESAKQSQGRIETRLDSINQFLREDSRETRDMIQKHLEKDHH